MWRITFRHLSDTKSGSVPRFRAPRHLHSAALALPSRPRTTPELTLLHLQLGTESCSPPPISDVHGTLNSVLWGIPWIANQMCLKLPEGHSLSEELISDFRAKESSSEQFLSHQLNAFVGRDLAEEAIGLQSPVTCLLADAPNLSYAHETKAKELPRVLPGDIGSKSRDLSAQGASRNVRALRARQLKIESEAWDRAAKEYKETLIELCKNKLAPNLSFMKSMFLSWFEPLRNAIAAEQEAYKICTDGRKSNIRIGSHLYLLSADKLAVITMHKTIARLMTDFQNGGLRVVAAAISIGQAVEQEVRLQHILKRKYRKKGEQVEESQDETVKAQINTHKALQKEVQRLLKQKRLGIVRKIIKEVDNDEPWEKAIVAKLGSRLLELFMETAYIQDNSDDCTEGFPEVRPAFRHICKTFTSKNSEKKSCWVSSRRYGIIECDPYIARGIHKMARGIVTPYMPMLVEPLPWTGYRRGGHLVLPSCIMRTHGARELGQTLKNTPRQQLRTVFEALDTLGSTKWRINTRILEVLEKVWEDGGRIADIVDRDDVPLPVKPDTDEAELLKKWKWDTVKAKRMNRELHSQRCDTELKLSVARQMKDEECFYYPHNIDFRGRAYPMHPHLNHLGSDVCRGLLEFGESRLLGSTGFKWLKIHLANLFGNGVGKLSNDDRTRFADENMENIVDSAMKPLEGARWWLKAEYPFQFLATCMEILNVVNSENPQTYFSQLPVHQDGSCNGLQHYAALGRDVLGAESVNLTVQDKPADVYSDIAMRVKGLMENDILTDSAANQDAANARLVHGQVDRKLVKQTVMTSVYGVTYIGARDQILTKLEERSFLPDSKEAFAASCYVARITLAALGEMFKNARTIMVWLGDCAKIIASQNKPVRWTTPLGLPVVQPYRKPCKVLVKTSLQVLAVWDANDAKVLVKRQKTAFPPNFVHSLDGAHMMMTANACRRAGLVFAGVHDSFWTHAGDVEKMNVILREKFVELYNQPVLENLLKEFETTFPEAVFPSIPTRGDFDLQKVLQAPYFFN